MCENRFASAVFRTEDGKDSYQCIFIKIGENMILLKHKIIKRGLYCFEL